MLLFCIVNICYGANILFYEPLCCSDLEMSSQQTQNICIAFVQRRPNVFDADPTLCKCYTNVLCLLGYLSVSIYN